MPNVKKMDERAMKVTLPENWPLTIQPETCLIAELDIPTLDHAYFDRKRTFPELLNYIYQLVDAEVAAAKADPNNAVRPKMPEINNVIFTTMHYGIFFLERDPETGFWDGLFHMYMDSAKFLEYLDGYLNLVDALRTSFPDGYVRDNMHEYLKEWVSRG